jgi:hypothetical protein
MFRLRKKHFLSPLGIFAVYTLAAGLVIGVFRFFLPPVPPPLDCFSIRWRIIQGVLAFLNLFPALALSSLVLPFGLRSPDTAKFPSFSARFLGMIRGSIITAIAAAAVYGLVFFLALPLVREEEEFMQARGRLFYLAKERAQDHAEDEDWPQTIQFVNICERIWPQSPEMTALRTASFVGMEEFRMSRRELSPEGRQSLSVGAAAAYSGIPGQQTPLTAAEALSLAGTSRGEGRLYDAHWLASLAVRLAKPNTLEAAAATRLAAEIWDNLAALGPNAREVYAWNLYRLKRDGYEAMIAGDWIRAYYLFREHASQSPGDPDVDNFLILCEQGIAGVAFFIDEIELAVGEILTGAVFSLPAEIEPGKSGGRVVLRISSLSTFPDYSYGVGIELIAFDREDQLQYRLEAPYAKIVPMDLEEKEDRLVLLMRALDRSDREKFWEPQLAGGLENGAEKAQLLLDLSYEDFLILSKIRRGPETLEPPDLFVAEKRLGAYGYVPQVFQGEIIYRLCEPVLFLPIAILTILAGWRFRAKTRPRYSGVPMMAILPLGFYGFIHFYRSFLNNAAIWTVVSFGYAPALAVFISGAVIFFIFSLIVLASQHG